MARYLSSAQDMQLYRAVVTVDHADGWTSKTVYGPYSRAGTAKQVGMAHVNSAREWRSDEIVAATCVVEQASTVWTSVT